MRAVPPALDVQLYRPPAGEEWRWIDAQPTAGVVAGTTVSAASGLLTAADRDETWNVVPLNFELNPTVSVRNRAVSIVVDAPLRATWNDQVGIADPRAALLFHGGTWGTLRLGTIAPVGTLDWPLTWDDWRVDTALSLQNDTVGAAVSFQQGSSSTVVRGVVGARLGQLRVETTLARLWWGGVDLFSGEVTASTNIVKDAWHISPLMSVGFTPTPGTPAIRAGVSIRRTPRPPRPITPPVVAPAPAPPPPAVLPEPVPAPIPEPPPAVVPPTPPKLRGVTLMTVHLTPPCQNTDEWLAANKTKVLAHVAKGGVLPEAVTFEIKECGTPLIQAEVVSVK